MRLNHASKSNPSILPAVYPAPPAKIEKKEETEVTLRIHKQVDQNPGFVPDIRDQLDSRFVS